MTTKTNERKAFEAWYESHLMPLESDWFKRDNDGDYTAMDTQSSWDAWQARAQLSTKQEWISVNDRLPEYGKEVIVYRIRSQRQLHNIVSCDYRGKLGSESRDMWMQTRGDEKISHWMPFPQSPLPESPKP